MSPPGLAPNFAGVGRHNSMVLFVSGSRSIRRRSYVILMHFGTEAGFRFREMPCRGGMLTKKGKYGLKAMVHLAGVTDGQLVSASEIAEKHHIPRKFLDNIFTELRNAGFVLSRKGKGGGFCLAHPANEIAIGNIIRALDGALAPIACASKTDYRPCEDCNEAECQVRHVMLDVREAIANVLDHRTLADSKALDIALLAQ
ncbi:Transcriptional regulator, Rrf2 family protein [Brucella sp. NF 2653]|nr:Transcriptional regulator, Rrf2 family protein [Brucella sp. NF 2653]